MLADLNKLHTAVWIYDIDNFCIVWANQAGLAFWGSTTIEALQRRDLKSSASAAVKQALLDYQTAFKQGKIFQENWQFTPNNKEITAFCQCSGIALDNGRIGMLVEATHINNHYSRAYFNDGVIIATYNTKGDYLGGNPSFTKAFGKNIDRLQQLFFYDEDVDQLFRTLEQQSTYEKDTLLQTTSGLNWHHLKALLTSDGNGNAVILLHKHNIDERKRFELSLEKQALTDPLTQLSNRRGLNNSIRRLIDRSQQKTEYFSLLFIDLDGFKAINDTYGHNAGDLLLVEFSQRVIRELDDNCELARYGGDEFVLLIKGKSSSQHLCDLSNQILRILSCPFDRVPIKSLSASIGSVRFPDDALDIDELISCADSAMYYAKRFGKKQYVQYQEGMNRDLKRASDIAIKLSAAIEHNSLHLHYQPIIDTVACKVVSFEALLRWVDDDLGYINPEEAVKVAEDKGLIEVLDTWVLNQALTDLIHLRQLFSSNLRICVNMSGLHLSRPYSADNICNLIKSYNLSPDSLNIELTEGVLIENLDNDDCQVQKLVEHGVGVSLDDFGTGYTSLAYLHHLPASILKVDKMFVSNIDKHKVTLECISKLSSSFNMESLVEGIETRSQAVTLQSMGFILQQGNWFGKPEPLEYYRNQSSLELNIDFPL